MFYVKYGDNRMMIAGRLRLCILAIIMIAPTLVAQQISVPRIDLMPNRPAPYLMRDWKAVAREYDSLVFDFNRTGTYLPLVWRNTNPVNYPSHNSFGLHTVVGTTSPASAEAINCLPAVVSATLVGIDKSSQRGENWPLMAEEWFNKRPEQNVYKNHPVDDLGDDWWYETMPNIFFYQLNDLYAGTGDFNNQFISVADRWHEAVTAMGGSITPWQIPNMDHRGWYLQTMTPYDDGVHEPEAAGAIGWLLYNAFVKTGNDNYRIGAEQAMDFLNVQTSNPAYELQLSYGTYLAARMNAELGTAYNLPKMVNWCFNVGPLRSWGAIVGSWGGYDCSGLIGEVNGINDYAFAMNTFEQVGALVPMVRYDDRFARAIGKWVLNAANAARLFYPNYLPNANQDSYVWAHQYDSTSTIAHEAMRQFNGGTSPYATGDAISGGWGATNLALYGSSHAGILGGIIETTNVSMILKLDLLKTDYYHDTAYPSFLYFNPYDSAMSVNFDAGSGQHDLYESVTNQFIATGVSGVTSFVVAPNSAALLIITPAGGSLSYALDKMLVDGVVVDYHSGQAVANYPPRIRSLAAARNTVLQRDTVLVYCAAMDRNGDTLMYAWQASKGSMIGTGKTVRWGAPDSLGDFIILCIVSDAHGGFDTATIMQHVVISINHDPVIASLSASPRKVDLGASCQLRCTASDPDAGDTLRYTWASTAGVITGSDTTAQWTAPAIAGNYLVRCVVDDGHGGSSSDSIGIEVRDFSQNQTGQLIAYFPCNGNANDSSGNNNNGTVHGAPLVNDRTGNPNSAYQFNGTTGYIQVPNSTGLNVQQSISINFWMNVGAFFTREQYPISHGNWENRWKVSITNDRVRWTVKTTTGIKDLDSETKLVTGTWYNVTVIYGGSDVEIFVNGNLDAFTSWSGTILPTTIDLTIGQVLPNNQGYNFQGVLDEIRIYDYALSMSEIQDLAGGVTAIGDSPNLQLPSQFILFQNYPNPFNPATTFEFGVKEFGFTTLSIFDMLGKKVATIVEEKLSPGFYRRSWDASAFPSGVYVYQLTTFSQRTTRKLLLLK